MPHSKPSKRHRFWAIWTGNKITPQSSSTESCATSDNIPNPVPSIRPQSPPRASVPSGVTHDPQASLAREEDIPHIMSKSTATITFSRPGVRPPVYVVTSLSDPPWTVLPMEVSGKQSAAGEVVFERRFENVESGVYQYKIRVGEEDWVVDEEVETGVDEHGNRNNVLRIGSNPNQDAHLATEKQPNSKDLRKDSTIALDEPHAEQDIPRLVVEKVDDESEETGEEPSELDAAPLFRHESIQVDEPEIRIEIENVGRDSDKFADSEDRSTGAASNSIGADISRLDTEPGAVTAASTDLADEQNHHDPRTAPNFPHEAEAEDSGFDELEDGLMLRHEKSHIEGSEEFDDEQDELGHGPLFRHESGQNGDANGSDDRHDELGAAPLLLHEAGFRRSSPSAPRISHLGDHDYNEHDDDENEAPLLPHERGSPAVRSDSGSDHGDLDFLSKRRQLSFEDVDTAKDHFHRRSFFRTRTSSSSLPHRLPKSDAEDENLHDPSLERFPTDRAHILERVATIGQHLPEDHPVEDTIHSPVISVFSQACSSVDLAPVKSYASLASVPEGDSSDEEEADVESLPSPVVLNFSRSQTSGIAADPYKTPKPDDHKRFGLGEGDTQKKGPGSIATPATLLKAGTPAEKASTAISTKDDMPLKDVAPQESDTLNDSDNKEPPDSSTPRKHQRGEVKSFAAAFAVAALAAVAWWFLGNS